MITAILCPCIRCDGQLHDQFSLSLLCTVSSFCLLLEGATVGVWEEQGGLLLLLLLLKVVGMKLRVWPWWRWPLLLLLSCY